MGSDNALKLVGGTWTAAANDSFDGVANEDNVGSAIFLLDVLANDSGVGKVLFSLDDGSNALKDLQSQDTARTEGLSSDRSALGARIWITSDGRVGYDSATLGSSVLARAAKLGAGESLTDSFAYAEKMADGSYRWATVSLRIQGVNDVVVIRPGADAAGQVEDRGEGRSALTTEGTVRFADADATDRHVVSVTELGTGYLGAFSTRLTEPDGSGNRSGDGSVRWAFSAARDDVRFLAEGEERLQSYAVTIADGQGSTAVQTITVRIVGSNERPVITSGPQRAEAEGAAAVAGQIRFTDVDQSDQHQVTLDRAARHGTVSLGSDGSWSYAGTSDRVAALEEGEVLHDRFTVKIDDGHGGTVTEVVRITIHGTNDAPRILAAQATAGLTELADHSAGEGTALLSASGQITFSDAEAGDRHSVTATPKGAGFLGSFTVSLSEAAGRSHHDHGDDDEDEDEDDDGDDHDAPQAAGTGQVNWSFKVADGALDHLAAGQVLTQSYDVTISDDHGGRVVQTVVVTLTGSNDGPVITLADAAGAAQGTGPVLTDTGLIAFADVDLTDSHTVLVSSDTPTLGHLTASVTQDGNGTGEVTWAYEVTRAALSGLGAGQTAVERFTVTVDDGHGGTVAQVVEVTVEGQGTPPVAEADQVTAQEDQTLQIAVADLLANDHDAESDSLTLTAVGGASHGTVALVNGVVEFTPDADFSGIGGFTYTLSDGSSSTTGEVLVDVAPVADAPHLTVTQTASGDPTPVPVTGDITVGAYSGDRALDDSQHMESIVTPLVGGGFVVVWDASRVDGTGFDAKARVYDAAGQPVTGVIAVSPAGFGLPGSRSPGVTALDDGGFAIAWPGEASALVEIRTFDATGHQLHSSQIAGPGPGFGPSLAMTAGGFIVTWSDVIPGTSTLTVFEQSFDNTGAPTSPYSVVPSGGFRHVGQSIATLDDGGYVIVWQSLAQDFYNGLPRDGSQFGIYGQRFDATHHPVGGEFLVNTVVEGNQDFANVAALPGGGFVVTWTGTDTLGRGVYGQIYGANGQPVGDNFKADNDVGVHQQTSSVVGLPDGGFVIVWEADAGDRSFWTMWGQRFDATGAKIGAAFIAEEVPDGSQRAPDFASGGSSVAVLADGTIAITWETREAGTVSVRLFDLPHQGAQEDQPVTLPAITATLGDLDGSETLTLRLSGYPAGANFSVGHAEGATWVIDDADQIAALATTPLVMTPPANYNGAFDLSVAATATDTAALSTGQAQSTATTTTSFTVTIAAVNDAASITGTATGSLSEDDTTPVTGQLTVQDPDAGEALATAASGTTAHGSYSVTADGLWSFTVNTASVQGLATGEQVLDSFTVSSLDGSATQTVQITINGADEAPVLPTLPVSGPPRDISAADFNGDGHADLIMNIAPHSVGLFLGNGDGTFAPMREFAVTEVPLFKSEADLNNDGFLDVMMGSYTFDGAIGVLFGHGDGTFDFQSFSSGAHYITMVNAADVNGDGSLDLVASDNLTGGVVVRLGHGDGTFQAPYIVPAGVSSSGVAAGDVNGDGFADLAVGNYFSNDVMIFLGDASGNLTRSAVLSNPGTEETMILDLNADGKADVLALDYTFGQLSVFMGHGDGSFGPRSTYAVGGSPFSFEHGDLDADGFEDIVVANSSTGDISVLFGNGDGTFDPAIQIATGALPSGVAIADLNSDGKLDLAVSHLDDRTVAIIFNEWA